MADNYLVKDGAGANLTKASKDLGTAQADKQVPISSSGAELFTTAAPGVVEAGGTKVTAATPPAGAVGFLGWISAIWYQLTQTLTVTGPVTDTQLRAAAVPINFAQTLDAANDTVRVEPTLLRIRDVSANLLVVKRARVTVTTTTTTSIVAAVTGKAIQVLGYSLQSQGSNTPTFNFQDNAGTPVVLSRTWKLDATGAAGPNGVQALPNPLGCGVDPTTSGQALMGKMDVTGSVVVEVTYVEV